MFVQRSFLPVLLVVLGVSQNMDKYPLGRYQPIGIALDTKHRAASHQVCGRGVRLGLSVFPRSVPGQVPGGQSRAAIWMPLGKRSKRFAADHSHNLVFA